MLTAYLVPYGIMQPVYGYLADRWGKARILKGVLSGLTAATAGCVLAPALVWLMICRFVAGFFATGIIAVSLAMIGDETEPEKRPQSVGLFMGMVFLGQGISAGFGGFFAGWLDWRMTFVCLIAIALVTLWLVPAPAGRPDDPVAKRFSVRNDQGRAFGKGTDHFSDGVCRRVSDAGSLQLSGGLSA